MGQAPRLPQRGQVRGMGGEGPKFEPIPDQGEEAF